jgi:hypothetical protein
MKPVKWKTYRTRFLIKAKQLSTGLTFTDHLGRQHCGRKGDYLVESCDGVLSIAPRQIFEDIYVPMGLGPDPLDSHPNEDQTDELKGLRFEPLRIEKIKSALYTDDQHTDDQRRTTDPERTVRIRKSPQPIRIASTRLTLM